MSLRDEYLPSENEGRKPSRGKGGSSKAQNLPPCDTEAEQGCLASILNANKETGRQRLKILSLDHFYDVRHQEIFRALCSLNGGSLDVVSVFQFLKDKNRLEDAGGLDYVQRIPDVWRGLGSWESFYATVENCRLRRCILQDAGQLASIANNRAIDPAAISDAARRLAEAYKTNAQSNTLTIRSPFELCAMQFDETDRILGDRLLSKGSQLVITGAGSIGKSRLALQMIACLVNEIQFIGFECRGKDMKWLVLQAENSNRRLQADLIAIRDWLTYDQWERFSDLVYIHTLETDVDSFLSLDDPKTKDRIADQISKISPNGVLCDSLYNFRIGDLNSDEDMGNTLITLSRTMKAGDPNRCITLLHHALTGKIGASKAVGYDRTSFARNSKVLHSWTRAQINVAPGSAQDKDLKVISCGKCNDGQEFEDFAVRLNPTTKIYEVAADFSMDNWQDELKGKEPPAMTADDVANVLTGPMSRTELRKRIEDLTGVTRQSANRYIRTALEEQKIAFDPVRQLFNRA